MDKTVKFDTVVTVCTCVCIFVSVCVEPTHTLVADDAHPPVGAVTAIFPWAAFSTIRTVVTRQTAVTAESVIQTHWKQQGNEYSLSPISSLAVTVHNDGFIYLF